MRLTAPNGDSVALNIAGYQYPDLTGSGPHDWDANWLIVEGRVQTGDSEWTFRDPCLTTWEALDLAFWLRGIADDRWEPRPGDATGEGGDQLGFTEPCIAFNYRQRLPEAAVIRVFFSHEALPPQVNGSEYAVEMAVPHESVAFAAADWDAELRAFPVRP